MLLYSGSSATVVREDLALKLCVKQDSQTGWTAAVGVLNTSHTCKTCMHFPELSSALGIEHKVHLTKKLDRCNMILGRDSLQELGGKLDFWNDLITCQYVEVPMRTIQQVSSGEESHFFQMDKPQAVADAMD
jgi:hypothetical protein